MEIVLFQTSVYFIMILLDCKTENQKRDGSGEECIFLKREDRVME